MKAYKEIKEIGLIISLYIFVWTNVLWYKFDINSTINNYEWWIQFMELHLHMAIDGISLLFIYLTSILCPLCLLLNWSNQNGRFNTISIISIEILLILVFQVMDLLFFYIFFEAILIPFFIFIGLNGYRARRIHAAYLLLFYTIVGSFLMLIAIFVLYLRTGAMDLDCLINTEWSNQRSHLVWILLFISFAIKIPVFPFHIWLPEAHVEAPTEGSVLLAGILLKLGTYGMIRFLFGLFPLSTTYFMPVLLLLSVLSIFYTSFATLRQIDIKRIIAYSSIAHMNICIVGLGMMDPIGIIGSILLMIGHGFISGALFFLVGILYSRFHTKIIKYYSGLLSLMPLFSFFFFIFTISNISMPGTVNFIGEFLILTSILINGYISILLISFIGIFIGSIYSMWLYNKITFGLLNKKTITNIQDIDYREISILLPLLFYNFWIGLYPKQWIDLLYESIPYMLEFNY